ncbi:MAG TPA: DUF1775 domain-containing protein [Pseudonocardia sp.]|nr:DUF1775 domain-containing protein [Pseudonocardia sp.]
MSSSPRRPAGPAAAVVVAPVVAALLLLPGAAAADVQVSADGATSGATDVTLTFRLTSDRPDVPVTRLEVHLPAARPLEGLEVPVPEGWSVRLYTGKPPVPLDNPSGAPVSVIVWERPSGSTAVDLPVRVGRLPEGAGPLRFRAVQTDAAGGRVEWSDTTTAGAPAPAHPSLVVPYAGAPPPAAAPGGGHHHRADPATVTAADEALAGQPPGAVAWTVALAGALFAAAGAGFVALGRRQRRRFEALSGGAVSGGAVSGGAVSLERGSGVVPPEPPRGEGDDPDAAVPAQRAPASGPSVRS